MELGSLSRAELAALVPELLLDGHMIDRAGMPHLIAAFGRDGMRDVAIEEWMGASPVYTRRMQRAMRFESDTVETIFKGMQLDIGAPPQFMDFRYSLSTPYSGEFWLDHCGALMDVEPMGEDYVVAMCHDIEDPTFDATAIATNRRAQVRPIHRPPREPADRHPHCHWTVIADDSHPELPIPVEAVEIGATRAAAFELADPDPSDDGAADYSGPLVADLRFDDFSRSALVRLVEEVCLQGHLLALSFRRSVRTRVADDAADELLRHQFTGVAGLAAERIVALFDLGDGLDAAAALFGMHPTMLPAAYVGVTVDPPTDDHLVVRFDLASAAMADGAWPSTLTPTDLGPLEAIVRPVDPRFRCRGEIVGHELVVTIERGEEPSPESDDVVLAKFSTGAAFRFEDRPTRVEIRPSAG